MLETASRAAADVLAVHELLPSKYRLPLLVLDADEAELDYEAVLAA